MAQHLAGSKAMHEKQEVRMAKVRKKQETVPFGMLLRYLVSATLI